MTILSKDEHKISYLAGLVDGEGSIMIAKMKTKRPYGKRNYITYSVRLSIANTNMNLMFWLKNEFGAKIYPINGKSTPIGNRRFGYIALFINKSAFAILDLVHQYLIIKKSHLEVMDKWPKGRGICPEIREILYQELKSLNRKGLPAAETECEGLHRSMRQSELLGNEPIEVEETATPLLKLVNDRA